MKFAAIADIHGNCPALEAVLADIAELGISEIVNLGDHVSGPLEAARTADLLIERGFPSVQGDQDRILVDLWRVGKSGRSDFQQLERKHFDWMANMPPTRVYRERRVSVSCISQGRCRLLARSRRRRRQRPRQPD